MWSWRQRWQWHLYKPRNAKICRRTPEPRQGWEGSSLRAFKNSMALPALWLETSGLKSCEKINFCSVKSPQSVVICYSNSRKLIQTSLVKYKIQPWYAQTPVNRAEPTPGCVCGIPQPVPRRKVHWPQRTVWVCAARNLTTRVIFAFVKRN